MRALLVPVLLALLLAGCSSPAGNDSNDPATTDPATDNARQSADVADVPAPTLFEEVSWDGELGTQLCVAQVCPVSTLGPPTDPLARDALVFIAKTQGPVALSGNLTLTWDAVENGPSERLTVQLAAYTGCADQCSFGNAEGTLTGPSPLSIPLDGIRLEAGESFGLYLRPLRSMVANTEILVAAGQAVHLEGTLGAAPMA